MTQVLARALAKDGHQVRSIGVYPTWYAGAETEQDEGVQVFRLPEREHSLGWIASRYQLYSQISQWIREGSVDIIEVPDYQGFASGWPSLPVPVVARLHGSLSYFASELDRPVNQLSYWLERASLRRADFICSVCRYTARRTEEVFKVSADSARILYNPVEVPASSDPRSQNRDRKRVVFGGTLTAKKGIVSLIKAWPLVLKVMPQAELHVFGKDGRAADGGVSMQAFLLSQLNGQQPSVRFHGHVTRAELFNAYRSAAVAVFPSYAEAFAVAPLEAMAVGCPTVFTQLGSGPELLEHGREGLLVNPDNPDDIAKSVLRILENPKLAAEIGAAGRTRVEQAFGIDRLVAQNRAFYEDCVTDFATRLA